MNRLSLAQQANIALHLVHRNSVQSTAVLCNCSTKTILRNLLWIGAACQRFHDRTVTHLTSRRIEADETWLYVFCKEDNIPEYLEGDREVGTKWLWNTFDPDSNLTVNWHVGGHEYSDALTTMMDLARRVPGRVQLTTDQLMHYRTAVEEAFGDRVDYATIRKIMHEPVRTPDLHIPRAQLKENRIASVYGKPNPDFITTTGVESSHSRLRAWNARMVRDAFSFSKSMAHLRAHIALHYCFVNFCRTPKSLRCSPAMQAALVSELWSIEDLLENVQVDQVRAEMEESS